MTKRDMLFNWGCNTSLLNINVEQAERNLQSLGREDQCFSEFLTSEEYDAFWDGYFNRPEYYNELTPIDVTILKD